MSKKVLLAIATAKSPVKTPPACMPMGGKSKAAVVHLETGLEDEGRNVTCLSRNDGGEEY